jgi:asparagine synthase (glutamine-hydrolysing)
LGAGSDVIALSMTHNEIVNWSDGPYIAALQKELPFSYLEIPTGAHDPLSDLEKYLVALDGPWISFGHSSSFIGKSTLAQEGCSIVLNGHGGDEIVSYGIGRLNELAMASQWWTLWQETRFVAPLYDASRWTIFSPYLDHIKPVRKIRNFLKALFKLPKTSVHSPSLITEHALRLVNERFGSTNVQPVFKHDHTERSLHIEGVTTPAFARAFEVMALASAEIGVESIFPFCCRDLVEFSISLPSETKLGGGFTRRIVREVLRNRVPDIIRTRLDKYDFGTAFAIGLTNRPRLADEIVEAYSGVLCELLVPEELQRLASQIQEKGKDVKREDILNIWRVLVAAKWLKIMVPLEE